MNLNVTTIYIEKKYTNAETSVTPIDLPTSPKSPKSPLSPSLLPLETLYVTSSTKIRVNGFLTESPAASLFQQTYSSETEKENLNNNNSSFSEYSKFEESISNFTLVGSKKPLFLLKGVNSGSPPNKKRKFDTEFDTDAVVFDGSDESATEIIEKTLSIEAIEAEKVAATRLESLIEASEDLVANYHDDDYSFISEEYYQDFFDRVALDDTFIGFDSEEISYTSPSISYKDKELVALHFGGQYGWVLNLIDQLREQINLQLHSGTANQGLKNYLQLMGLPQDIAEVNDEQILLLFGLYISETRLIYNVRYEMTNAPNLYNSEIFKTTIGRACFFQLPADFIQGILEQLKIDENTCDAIPFAKQEGRNKLMETAITLLRDELNTSKILHNSKILTHIFGNKAWDILLLAINYGALPITETDENMNSIEVLKNILKNAPQEYRLRIFKALLGCDRAIGHNFSLDEDEKQIWDGFFKEIEFLIEYEYKPKSPEPYQ